ncbi:SIR2 family protein [Pseudomonas vanderleydeniana]|uniref:SIR2 family protein n=1 Tax=Pseudomonas vanderleydeniana TaxID=2745495 RepID=A0A9E6PJG4_9PSED|nr:SIR2 family protein [Pseudomonas vanderleydeniana]QXI27452.1 SIR2 family protein [Pseudomonas vanderleydeniana]
MSVVLNGLQQFFGLATNPIIFTGAGVSVRAGLPTWKGLIVQLAEQLRQADSLTCQLMLQCVEDGNYTTAIDYFNITKKMVEGEKLKLLKAQFSSFDAKKISAVGQLPFKACVTTNFDRSILDAIAIARQTTAVDYKYGDASFRQAQWEDGLFVARIHGAAEFPASIILSDGQFDNLLKDDTYKDFLRDCFVNRNVLFMGFSFYDPAIKYIFNEIDKRFGPATPGRHMALLPEDISSEFLSKASRLNIDIVKYDSANNHEALWEGIKSFNKVKKPAANPTMTTTRTPFDATKHYLAACYSRAKTQDSSTALRHVVIEGIVSAMLQEAAPGSITRSDILEKIRLQLGLKGRDAEAILNRATKSLIEDGLCVKQKGSNGSGIRYAWKGEPVQESMLDASIRTLCRSFVDRAYLEEKWTVPEPIIAKIVTLFNHLIKRRGWDLGAAFASGRAPENISLEAALAECNLRLVTFDQQRVLQILKNMLFHPTTEESKLLGELGRISFAMELAFHAPERTLLHKMVLPRDIYFDANVLLPALVPGHPFSQVYKEAIKSLKEAASSAAVTVNLNVCSGYLNEVISHRNLAITYYNEAGSDFGRIARSDALYNGVSNLNVFVGAYANWANQHGEVDFLKYLAEHAPYRDEAALRTFLTKQGFTVISARKGPHYPEYYAALEKAYADPLTAGKRPILIEHDSIQLAILREKLEHGDRSLFVTSDRKLQSIVSKIQGPSVLEAIVGHVGLIQLIEIMLGGISEGAGLTELLWSSKISNGTQAIRSHLVSLGLSQYDDGIAMTMPEIIEQFSELASSELERAGADLDAYDPKRRVQAFRTLGALEESYMKSMHEAARKLEERLQET